MKKYYLIISLLIFITLLSCTESASLKNGESNSIYYWRTTFSLSDSEKEFMREHDVKKILWLSHYLRNWHNLGHIAASQPDVIDRKSVV